MLQKHELNEKVLSKKTMFVLYIEFSTINMHKALGVQGYANHLASTTKFRQDSMNRALLSWSSLGLI